MSEQKMQLIIALAAFATICLTIIVVTLANRRSIDQEELSRLKRQNLKLSIDNAELKRRQKYQCVSGDGIAFSVMKEVKDILKKVDALQAELKEIKETLNTQDDRRQD